MSFFAAAQEAAYFGRLQDDEPDTLEAVLRLFSAVPKHNPLLLGQAASNGADDEAAEDSAVQQAPPTTLIAVLRAFHDVQQSSPCDPASLSPAGSHLIGMHHTFQGPVYGPPG